MDSKITFDKDGGVIILDGAIDASMALFYESTYLIIIAKNKVSGTYKTIIYNGL